MSAINAIFAKLSATSAVTALVGTNIEPQVAKQTDTYPCVTFTEEGIEYAGQHSGSAGIATSKLSIDCEAATYTQAVAVASAVRAALNFQKGTWGGVVVQGSFVDDESEDYEFIDNENTFYGVTVKATVVFEL